MEKYSNFADSQTGKMAFNQPQPIYTTLSCSSKFLRQAYYYTFYPALVVLRLPFVLFFTLLWIMLPFPRLFSRLILLTYGYLRIPLFQASKSQHKRFKVPKKEKQQIFAAQFTSPTVILVVSAKFGINKVLLPHKKHNGFLHSAPIAYLRALYFMKTFMNESPSNIPDAKLEKLNNFLVFPDGFMTNGIQVFPSYLHAQVFVNKQIFCLSLQFQERIFSRVHPSPNFITLADDLGSFVCNAEGRVSVLASKPDREPNTVSAALGTCGGCCVGTQSRDVRIAFYESCEKEEQQ